MKKLLLTTTAVAVLASSLPALAGGVKCSNVNQCQQIIDTLQDTLDDVAGDMYDQKDTIDGLQQQLEISNRQREEAQAAAKQSHEEKISWVLKFRDLEKHKNNWKHIAEQRLDALEYTKGKFDKFVKSMRRYLPDWIINKHL